MKTQVQIGNTGTEFDTVDSENHCRTQAQYEAVMAWHQTHPATFWCGNAFKVAFPGEQYKCTFAHHYFDENGKYQMLTVTPTGRTTLVGSK